MSAKKKAAPAKKSAKKKPDAAKHHRSSKRKKATPASWKPGQSGNPAGRPRLGNALAEIWRSYLDEPAANGRSRKERLIERLYKIADKSEPSIPAIRLIVDTISVPASFEERLAALEAKQAVVPVGLTVVK